VTQWSGAEVDDKYRINTLFHKTIDQFDGPPEVTIDKMVAKLSPWQAAAQVLPAWRGSEVDDKYRINTSFDVKIPEFDGPPDFYDSFETINGARWFPIFATGLAEAGKSTAGLKSFKLTSTSTFTAGVLFTPAANRNWPNRSIVVFAMIDDDDMVSATEGFRISVVGGGGLSACNYGSDDGLVAGVWAPLRCDLTAPFDVETGGGADFSVVDGVILSFNDMNRAAGRILNLDAYSVVPNDVDTIERMVDMQTPWTEAALA